MLEKQRESLAASKNYQKVKAHVQRNKLTYSCFGSAIASGLLVGVLKSRPTIVNNITQVTPSIAPVITNAPIFNNSNQQSNVIGPCCKIVKRLEDNKLWEKSIHAARELAEEQHISLDRAKWLISRNANGAIPDVFGMHYQNLATHTAS